jgi:uncharacterized protein YchJ
MMVIDEFEDIDRRFRNVPFSTIVQKNSYRNRPCLCGSGKKTKVCCWNKMAKKGQKID